MEMELKSLWKTVFGDTDDYIELFFDTFYSPELCAVCKCGGKTAAAGSGFPALTYMPWEFCRNTGGEGLEKP